MAIVTVSATQSDIMCYNLQIDDGIGSHIDLPDFDKNQFIDNCLLKNEILIQKLNNAITYKFRYTVKNFIGS